MNNIYLFHGENTASSKNKLTTWIEKLASKSDINFDLSDIDVESANWDSINEALMLLPLFGEKRLVIVRNLFTSGTKDNQIKMIERLKTISPEIILVIYENRTIKVKSPAFAELNRLAKGYHFPVPDNNSIIKIATELLNKLNKKMDLKTLIYFCNIIGTDVVRLETELEKLSLATENESITILDVKDLVASYKHSKIFELIDAIMSKNSRLAADLILKEMDFGAHHLQINTMLINQIRKMIILKECLDNKRSESEIVTLMQTHPYALSKMKNNIRNVTLGDLINYYKKLVQADILLKQGFSAEQTMLNLVR